MPSRSRSASAFCGRDHRVVRAEQDLLAPVGAQVADELGRIAAGRVGGGVDVDVRVLARQRDHLLGPRVADVAADDHELGEVERDVVEVRDRPAGLGGAQRPGVADLQAERDAELDALGVERVVAAVVGRQAPQPRDHAQALEAELADAAPQLAHRGHRLVQVDRGERDEAVRVLLDEARRPRRWRSSAPPARARRSAPRVDTPPASIAATVVSSGISPSGIASPVQRRRDSNISWRRNRAVGCCIQTSIVTLSRYLREPRQALRPAAPADGADLLPLGPARPQLGARGLGHGPAQGRPHGRVRAAVVPVVAGAGLRQPGRRRSRSRCCGRRATSTTSRSSRGGTARRGTWRSTRWEWVWRCWWRGGLTASRARWREARPARDRRRRACRRCCGGACARCSWRARARGRSACRRSPWRGA